MMRWCEVRRLRHPKIKKENRRRRRESITTLYIFYYLLFMLLLRIIPLHHQSSSSSSSYIIILFFIIILIYIYIYIIQPHTTPLFIVACAVSSRDNPHLHGADVQQTPLHAGASVNVARSPNTEDGH